MNSTLFGIFPNYIKKTQKRKSTKQSQTMHNAFHFVYWINPTWEASIKLGPEDTYYGLYYLHM